MITLLLATRNEGKRGEIAVLLRVPGLRLVSLTDVGVSAEVEECGKSFAANARLKADYFSRLTGLATLGEDSGLEVPALGNRPGVFSARFAGAGANDGDRIAQLLDEMTGIRERRARFVAAACLSCAERPLRSFSSRVNGEILAVRRGSGGFGYDPVFYYPPLNRTFAELTPEEKNRVSHRARVMEKVRCFIERGGLADRQGAEGKEKG